MLGLDTPVENNKNATPCILLSHVNSDFKFITLMEESFLGVGVAIAKMMVKKKIVYSFCPGTYFWTKSN